MNADNARHKVSLRRDELGDYLAWRKYKATTPEKKNEYSTLIEKNEDRRIKEYDRIGMHYQVFLEGIRKNKET